MTQTPSPLVLPDGFYESFSGTVGSKKVRVWAIKANLTHFATATADSATAPAAVTWNVGATKVRRYPGDPTPFNRLGYTATKQLPITRGKAIPGRPFALQDLSEYRTFSYVGALTTLVEWLRPKVKADCMLITPSGRVLNLDKPGP